MRGSTGRRLTLGMGSLALAVLAIAAGQRALRENRLIEFHGRVSSFIAEAVHIEDPGLVGRINPAALPASLANPDFGRDLRAEFVAGERDYLRVEPSFVAEAVLGYGHFCGASRMSSLALARTMRAYLLAERGRYELDLDRNSLKQAIVQYSERITASPVDALSRFEIALAADALSRLEDDSPAPERLDRARRLRLAAEQQMAEAVRLAHGVTSFDLRFVSSFYISASAGSFFVLRHRESLARGDLDSAAHHLEQARRAFHQAIAFDPTPLHVERIIDLLRDVGADDDVALPVDWDDIEIIFEGARAPSRLRFGARLLVDANAAAQVVETISRILDDRTASAGERAQARALLVRAHLRLGQLDEADAQVRAIAAGSPSRDRDLAAALREYDERGHVERFYRLVNTLIEKHVDLRVLLLIAGDAAVRAGDRDAALRLLERFVSEDEGAGATRNDLRAGKLLLARLYAEAGNFAAAITYYRSLWVGSRDDRAIGMMYAEILLRADRKDEARAQVLEMVDRWGDEPAVMKLLERVR